MSYVYVIRQGSVNGTGSYLVEGGPDYCYWTAERISATRFTLQRALDCKEELGGRIVRLRPAYKAGDRAELEAVVTAARDVVTEAPPTGNSIVLERRCGDLEEALYVLDVKRGGK